MIKTLINPRRKGGFTLIETVVYVAIFSIFISFALGFFWQMQQARIRSDISREIKESASQSLELLKGEVRTANGLDSPGSQLGADFSALSVLKTDGNALFDTYQKSVVVGGNPVEIRKLRLSLPHQSPEDVTSDHVTVTRFEVSDAGGGENPTALQIRLTLAAVNPGSDPLYDSAIDFSTPVSFRVENP
jgi:prepilin-type N-terminal cleavage/methylation domain-containing protein